MPDKPPNETDPANTANRATRDTWKIRPLPERRTQLAFKRAFSREEYQRVALGFVPREMEDKWFIYLNGLDGPDDLDGPDGEWLYLHRSWTGICIYSLRLLPIGEGHRVSEAWVNRDPEEYRMVDDQYDAELLQFLIDSILLGKADAARPLSPLNRPKGALSE